MSRFTISAFTGSYCKYILILEWDDGLWFIIACMSLKWEDSSLLVGLSLI